LIPSKAREPVFIPSTARDPYDLRYSFCFEPEQSEGTLHS
jgi:hypothetical protein